MHFLTCRRSAPRMTTTPVVGLCLEILAAGVTDAGGLAAVTSATAIAQTRGKGNARASGGVDGFYTQTNTREL